MVLNDKLNNTCIVINEETFQLKEKASKIPLVSLFHIDLKNYRRQRTFSSFSLFYDTDTIIIKDPCITEYEFGLFYNRILSHFIPGRIPPKYIKVDLKDLTLNYLTKLLQHEIIILAIDSYIINNNEEELNKMQPFNFNAKILNSRYICINIVANQKSCFSHVSFKNKY